MERMWSDMLPKSLQGQQFRQMRSMVMNCPIDCKDSNYSSRSNQDNPETSSQVCVGEDGETLPITNLGVRWNMAPMILRLDDRPKIQNLDTIHDTYDVVERDNITDTKITDNLLPIKNVRWKDIAETNSATKKDGKD